MKIKQDRGFRTMDPAKQKEIARQGGRRAHLIGRAHKWTSEEAREAGRKGGLASNGGRGKFISSSELNDKKQEVQGTEI